MYVFGDSLSDTGNVSLATFGLLPVSPPYADRSFSNGPVWAQDLAQSLGLTALQPSLAGGTDFAYGGAETGQTPTHTLNPTDLPSQFTQFQTQVASPQAGALYAVWIGSNDVLDIANNSSLTPAQQQADVAAACEQRGVGDRRAGGARRAEPARPERARPRQDPRRDLPTHQRRRSRLRHWPRCITPILPLRCNPWKHPVR